MKQRQSSSWPLITGLTLLVALVSLNWFVADQPIRAAFAEPGVYLSDSGIMGKNGWYKKSPIYQGMWDCPFRDGLMGSGSSLSNGRYSYSHYSYVYYSPPGQGLGACSQKEVRDDGLVIGSNTEDHGYPAGAPVAPDGIAGWSLIGNTPVVAVDSRPPQITIESPNELATFYTASVEVTGSIRDPSEYANEVSGVASLTVNGNPVAVVDERWRTTVSGLVNGKNEIIASAEDRAGNVGTKKLNVLYAPPRQSSENQPNTNVPSSSSNRLSNLSALGRSGAATSSDTDSNATEQLPESTASFNTNGQDAGMYFFATIRYIANFIANFIGAFLLF